MTQEHLRVTDLAALVLPGVNSGSNPDRLATETFGLWSRLRGLLPADITTRKSPATCDDYAATG
jgi:hypothetical protein